MNIQIKVSGYSLHFSKYNKKIESIDLNNTNVISEKCMVFSQKYIEDNYEILSAFFNLIVLKKKINSAIIKSNDIAVISLSIIKYIDSIINITFIEDKELDYTISSMLLENNNLKSIECYNMPEIMYYRFNDVIVKTRCKILFKSEFMHYNNINTFSDLYNKDKIVIDSYLTTYDVDDIIFFLKTNKKLKKIILRGYIKSNLVSFVNLILENNLDKVTIIILQDDNNIKDLMKDIKLFDKLCKKNNINIKIKYTNKYKNKNKYKEINLNLIKYSMLLILIVSVSLLFAYKFTLINSEKNVEKINKNIESIVNNAKKNSNDEMDNTILNNLEEEYVSAYYQNYNNIYSELLKLNSDTIGWIKVNNTKVNYPVVQYSDNDYYLTHAYDKSNNIIGWIFADYRNDFNEINKNTIVYGHSMVNGGLMFTTLDKVLNETWYSNENNLNIEFSIKNNKYMWKIFSIYVIDTTNDYLYINFDTNSDFFNFVDKIKDRSIYNFNQDINENDKILTLSTCYKDDNHRLVVHAVLK